MNTSMKNLMATFAGAAAGFAVEHSQAISILYVVGGAVAGPVVLNWIERRRSQRQADRLQQPSTIHSAASVAPHFE